MTELKTLFTTAAFCFLSNALLSGELEVGAAVVEITPEKFPVSVNGSFLPRTVDTVDNPIHARAIILKNGDTEIAIVVVDSCMMPRPLIDSIKKIAAMKTKIPPDRQLISATHTHSAPSVMSCLGSPADADYTALLVRKVVEVIVNAQKNTVPAEVGFNNADASEFTALRRWIRLPDSIENDPFGNPTVRANMHSGRDWSKVAGESGPEDPELSLIAFRARKSGEPIAVLANFSMHYFSDKAIGADYFGRFSEGLKRRIAPDSKFVGILSHGCSGDIWRRDYTKPQEERNEKQTIDEYTNDLLDVAMTAFEKVEYQPDGELKMAESRLNLAYRVPDAARLEWAKRVISEMKDPEIPTNKTEVYAQEAIILHERKATEVVVQALRIGDDIAIATTPTETYAITGLKIKAASPVKHTMVFDLANGGDGYIPPPEQHLLGGYNTWPARSAGLEIEAEPKITAAAIHLLEAISGKPRIHPQLSRGKASLAITNLKPKAYWPLNEFSGRRASDLSGNHFDSIYEPQIAFYLEGPHSEKFCANGETNRAPHFVDDRLRARIPKIQNTYSISLWFWNGMPNDRRADTGWIFSRGNDQVLGQFSDHLGISGTGSPFPGRLTFFHGADPSVAVFGKKDLKRWEWNHLVFTRQKEFITVHLNGILDLETEAPADFPIDVELFFFGGRSDNINNFEGRLDEIAVFDRALSALEIESLSPN